MRQITLTKLFVTSALIAGFAAPAYAQGTDLIIEDFIGTVHIVAEDRNDIQVTQKKNAGSVEFDRAGSGLTINGGVDDLESEKCKGYYGSFGISWFKKDRKEGNFGGYEDLEDLPKLTISAPRDTNLVIRHSIPFLKAGDLGSADLDISHCGEVELGNIDGPFTASVSGSGDLQAGNAGDADIRVSGSGDVDIGNVGQMELRISGSGDVSLENAGPSVISISGSGDIEMEDISGSVDLKISGSGDMEAGEIHGDLYYRASGSGNFYADEVNGDLDIVLKGSGEAEIDGGKADHIEIRTSGASDVHYDGVAQTANLRASGASDIYVNKVEGELVSEATSAADIDVNN